MSDAHDTLSENCQSVTEALRTQSDNIDSNANQSMYDEQIPDIDPEGVLSIEERRNQQSSDCVRGSVEALKIALHPSTWKNKKLSAGMDDLLDVLFLKDTHRSHMMMTKELLITMATEVHDHMASRARKIPLSIPDLESVAEMDGLNAFHFCLRLRNGLNRHGWCLIDNCSFLKDDVDHLVSVYKDMPDSVDGTDLWEIIRDKQSDDIDELSRRGYGRRMTSRYAVMEYLETSESWKNRVRIDVYIALIARALSLGSKRGDGWDLCIPSTGGRWLRTDPNTDVQEIHCDNKVLKNLDHDQIPASNPGYFVMVSGSSGFYLWIAQGSHSLYQTKHYKNNLMVVKKVFVSPYSVFMGRGDLFHAGDKFDGVRSKSQVRYHMLLSNPSENIANEIQFGPTGDIQWIDPYKHLVQNSDEHSASK